EINITISWPIQSRSYRSRTDYHRLHSRYRRVGLRIPIPRNQIDNPRRIQKTICRGCLPLSWPFRSFFVDSSSGSILPIMIRNILLILFWFWLFLLGWGAFQHNYPFTAFVAPILSLLAALSFSISPQADVPFMPPDSRFILIVTSIGAVGISALGFLAWRRKS